MHENITVFLTSLLPSISCTYEVVFPGKWTTADSAQALENWSMSESSATSINPSMRKLVTAILALHLVPSQSVVHNYCSFPFVIVFVKTQWVRQGVKAIVTQLRFTFVFELILHIAPHYNTNQQEPQYFDPAYSSPSCCWCLTNWWLSLTNHCLECFV